MESKELDELKNEYLNESMSEEALLKVRKRMEDAKRDNRFEERRHLRSTIAGYVATAAVLLLCVTPFIFKNGNMTKSAAPEVMMARSMEAPAEYKEAAVEYAVTENAESVMESFDEADEKPEENSAESSLMMKQSEDASDELSDVNEETMYDEATTGEIYEGFNFSTAIFILEMIGTVAFAISGVMVAKEKKMDIFGAIVLGSATAVGGGVIRDLLLGAIPPVMFREPIYVTVAAVTCIIDFIIEKNRKAESVMASSLNQKILNAADSIGLAAFVVVGCRASINAGFNDHMLLSMFVGVMTGIGGGILRDILAGQMPLIMRKRVYGMAAVAGAVSFYVTDMYFNIIISAIISMTVVVLIRFLAIHFEWNLPSF
jgi:uncharacterized membrane protein YeiH